MPRHLFVTGSLARPALERTLASMEFDGEYRIAALGITVASLMSTEFIAKKLPPTELEELIVIPGLCNGPVETIEEASKCKVLRGPNDLKDLPRFFGRQQVAPITSKPKLAILAEIVDAPRLTIDEILRRAAYFRSSGADFIDLGTDVYGEFPHLKETVQALRKEDYRVSIDSLHCRDIECAVSAGAEMVLSINSSNLALARELNCKSVVIPDEDRSLATLFANADHLLALGKSIVLDPILPPLMFGFAEGLRRYAIVRDRYPDIPALMGLGNVTELADADTTGMNAVLVATATELGVDYVLTTECGSRTRGAVKEVSLARTLMHSAQEAGSIPRHFGDGLLTIRDVSFAPYSAAELREFQTQIRDRNFRIFTDENEIHVFNANIFVSGRDPDALFRQLGELEPSHACYLGRELYKASLALTLGKRYTQDQDLRWGYMSAR